MHDTSALKSAPIQITSSSTALDINLNRASQFPVPFIAIVKIPESTLTTTHTTMKFFLLKSKHNTIKRKEET